MRNILLDFVRKITPSLLISLLSPLKFKRGNSRLGGRGEILSSKRGGAFAITIVCLFFFGSVSAAGVNYNNTTFKPLVTSGDVVGQFANCSGEQYLGADGECHDVSSGGLWDAATGGINYAGGNVGIGTTEPGAKLEVVGDLKSTTSGWFRGSADGSAATALNLGRQSGSESALFSVITDDISDDLLKFTTGRYAPTYEFQTSSSELGRIPMVKFLNNNTVGAIIEVYGGSLDNTVKTRINANGNSYFNGGNVGIGTTSPNSNGGVNATILHINDVDTGNWSGLHITNGNTGSLAADGTILGHIGDNNFQIFNYENSDIKLTTNAVTRMTIKSDGNVGIGDTVPESKLDVNGDIHLTDMTAPTTTTNKLYSVGGVLKWAGATVATGDLTANTISQLDSSVTVTDTGTNGTITMKTDNVARMTIDEDGNVGIGTVGPKDKLHVAGDSYFSAAFEVANDELSYYRPNMDFMRSRGTLSSKSIVQNGDWLNSIRASGYDGTGYREATYIRSNVDGTPGVNDMPGRLIFGTTADGDSVATQRMTIDSTGNVGIGVTSPTKKLHVDGGARFDNTSSTDAVELGDGKIYWDTTNSELVIQVN